MASSLSLTQGPGHREVVSVHELLPPSYLYLLNCDGGRSVIVNVPCLQVYLGRRASEGVRASGVRDHEDPPDLRVRYEELNQLKVPSNDTMQLQLAATSLRKLWCMLLSDCRPAGFRQI